MDVPNSGAIFTLGKSYLAENTQSYFYIKNDPIKKLISGPHQSAVICESGRLFAWGENHYGQLGIGGISANNKASNTTTNGTDNSNGQNSDIITKPTCVKSLKTLGLKIADIAYGNNWAVILAHSNELFFSGRNIFDSKVSVSRNFTEATIANETCAIIRKPFRLEEFDDCLSHSEEAENFVTVLAGNEHFAVMTSFGRLIGWGSNHSHQLGGQNENSSDDSSNEILLQPIEIVLDAPVRQFACGPESTLVLTESGNLFITGRLNDLVFTEFVVLQKNLSAAEQIIFMHISKASEIFIVTNAGSIFRSTESVRNKSLIFQRFYDYDSEENGPIWKMLKGFSFYAVLTKANKFYTTFSESGHHLKTFREISKFKNLRLLDMTVGDQHILVHGIPRSSTLSATVGPGGEHRFMSRTFVMPNQLVNGDGANNNNNNNNSNSNNNNFSDSENIRTNSMGDEKAGRHNAIQGHIETNDAMNKNDSPEMVAQREKTRKTEDNALSENGNGLIAEIDDKNDDVNANEVKSNDEHSDLYNENRREEMTDSPKSPTESMRSRKSAHSTKSIKFEASALEKSTSSEKLMRPRTPYPESSTGSTPQTIKKTPLRNYSYEAAMNNDYLERTSPPLGENLEEIPESAGDENALAPITAIISSPTPPTEEDEELTVEINTTTDALDHTIVVNEIRFINNGVDVTANVKQNTMESESDCDATEEDGDDGEDARSIKALEGVQKAASIVNEKTVEARKQAEGMLDKLEQEIVEKVDQAAELKSDAQKGIKKAINEVETKANDAQATVETATKNVAREAVDAVGENVKRVANDARHAVEHVGQGALKVASDARQAVDNAFTKVASEAKHAVGAVTTKFSNEMQEAKGNLTTLLQPKTTTPKQMNDDYADDEPSCKDNGGDDERTTASVNSNHTSSAGGGNPFESGNPFENDSDDGFNRGKQILQEEIKDVEHTKGRMRQFFDDVCSKSKAMSCRNEKSIQIDDEPPRYSLSDELNAGKNRNENDHGGTTGQNTSKVCTIL